MNLRARLVGLTATLLLVGIVVALPITLIALGAAPIPTHLPSADQVRTSLTNPDDGTLALGAIKVIAWITWAVLTWFIAVEIVARLRGVTITPPRGLAMPQLAARGLVAAAALLFISAGSAAPAIALTTPAHAVATAASVPGAAALASTVVDVRDHAPHSSPTPKTPAVSSLATHTVVHGESLWSIAQTHLGSGERYRDILAVNQQLGSHPDFLTPGTVLQLPAAHQAADRTEHQVTVHRGETLSGIAQRELGDADRYPEIYEASTGIRQPGGHHLSDPDVIDVGWTLTIPGTPPAPATATTPTPPSPPVAPQPPTPGATTPTSPPTSIGTPKPSATSASPPSASAPGTSAAKPSGQSAAIEAEHTDAPAPWMLAGLTGAGAVLAGGMMLALRARRRTQFRNRRPGRSITAPDPVLAPVEKTVMTLGRTAGPTVEFLDDALRRLAGVYAAGEEHLPDVAAVTLHADAITLHLSHAATLPGPWQGDEDRLRWSMPTGTDPDSIGQPRPDHPAPFPLLVTIGVDDDGSVWLFNLEDLGVVAITGDATYAADLARSVAAEIAVNPWSSAVRLDCIEVGQELEPINPGRLSVHPVIDAPRLAADVLTDAVAVVDRSSRLDLPVSTARAAQAGSDSWGARMLLIDRTTSDCPELVQLIDLLGHHGGQTGTAVVITGEDDPSGLVTMHVSEHGRLLVPSVGLDLVAAGLTSDEAQGCAALLSVAAGDNPPDVPTPVDDSATEGWRSMVDLAGSLRAEHVLPRTAESATIGEPASSILAEDDQIYVATGATTVEDLQALAPVVTDTTRVQLQEADPSLDDDVSAWFDPDCLLPRLSVIGPVSARAHGQPLPSRKPYFTEMLAYLALKPHGVPPEELASVFNLTPGKAREYARTIRLWLGKHLHTGALYLPNAPDAPSARTRGVPLYELNSVLVDAHLMFRLRARGQARGADGIEDLRTALRLVNGRPFDQLRKQGWAWLFEGDRLDHHLVCAIVDIAQVVVTHDLALGDIAGARLAAETALLAAPDDEVAFLNMALVAKAAGHHREAEQIVREQICDRTDDDGPPPELAERTEQILTVNQWLTPGKVAS